MADVKSSVPKVEVQVTIQPAGVSRPQELNSYKCKRITKFLITLME
ncbi:hypothetical protein Dthio_PD3109 [Desulfonatronospira thiodismutans ASO3-1]|uniref:Uncharacterized protein n=1 Tax=Desulfonatronospira thiodismutans ASO3-1 TaxID=555779 RepID=D6SLW9_9BACT|nr:hypothetical protein Dthio_PD3109 [Desulfonatronospira thiodismutans ASO3-1]